MHKRNLIEDNKKAENQSFLYFLHEEKKFDVKALDNLCHYIIELDTISLEQLRDIHYIENQILRHLVYHFDDNDLSKISNLPFEYWEYIEPFERLVACLYEGESSHDNYPGHNKNLLERLNQQYGYARDVKEYFNLK